MINEAMRRMYAQSRQLAKMILRDGFLRHVSGVIHVGANSGQEREIYERFRLDVIWVEPIPQVFSVLEGNLRTFPRQRAYRYLLTDQDHQTYDFKIANNGGQSSSIFDLALHKEIWRDVDFVDSIQLSSATLATMIEREAIDASKYQALVMDTQGSELLVLKGAGNLLGNFQYIKTEAADFESYAGCCKADDLTAYLKCKGFQEVRRRKFASRSTAGNYFDILYRRN